MNFQKKSLTMHPVCTKNQKDQILHPHYSQELQSDPMKGVLAKISILTVYLFLLELLLLSYPVFFFSLHVHSAEERGTQACNIYD